MLAGHSTNPRAWRIRRSPLCPGSLRGMAKAGRQHVCLRGGSLNVVSPPVRPAAQKHKGSVPRTSARWKCTRPPGSSGEDAESRGVFLPASPTCVPQPTGQGVLPTWKSCDLSDTVCKALAAVDGDSSGGSGPSPLKPFWKGFAILDAMKDLAIRGKKSKRQPQGEFGRSRF